MLVQGPRDPVPRAGQDPGSHRGDVRQAEDGGDPKQLLQVGDGAHPGGPAAQHLPVSQQARTRLPQCGVG